MYSRRKIVKLSLAYFGMIYLTLIIACAPLADAGIFRNGDEDLSGEGTKKSFSTIKLLAPSDIRSVIRELEATRKNIGDRNATSVHRIQLAELPRWDFDPFERLQPVVTERLRRDDKETVIKNEGSSKDYMSIYYAQRKAIMDKYMSQQKKIRERLKKARSSIAATKKRKESRKIDSDLNNPTRDPTTETPPPKVTLLTTESTVFVPTTTNYSPATVPTNSSTIFDDTQIRVSNNSQSLFNSSEDETEDYESGEPDFVTTTALPILYDTLRPPVASDRTDKPEAPHIEPPREENWQTETENLLPQNEVDFNLTDQNLVRQARDNDTLIIDLGGQLTNPSVKNESVRAFEQLEEMFYWEDPMDDERSPDIIETGSGAQDRIEDNSTTKNGNNSEHASQSSDSLRFTVEIKSSPEVHVTKNVKTHQTSTTTYRNSTHEVIDIDGVTNSTNRTNGVTAESLPPFLKNINFTYPVVLEPSAVGVGGGATESEWCEECPHDYRWGDCDGTLFYVHNAFLRNKGPSAIDAVFGMNVDGPISITCVEALRYNQTRGIVTLHSGGPGHDFAKIRIRGFQGEGFSYIMKVWGVSNQ